MGVDKFIQPADGIVVTHKGESHTIISPDMAAPYAKRIAAGEDRDKVLTEFAMEIVELEDSLREDGFLPELEIPESVLRTAEGDNDHTPSHEIADKFEKSLTLTVQLALIAARRALSKDAARMGKPNVDHVLEILRASLGRTLPKSLARVANAGADGAVERLATLRASEGFRTAKKTTPFSFSGIAEAVVSWADKYAAELIKQIDESTRDAINEAVAQALEGGDLEDLYDLLLEEIGDENRAKLIARTEVMRAQNAGQRLAWQWAQQDGLLESKTKVAWIATSDACPICEALDGKTRSINGKYPGDGGEGPPQHPNCRCTEGIVG